MDDLEFQVKKLSLAKGDIVVIKVNGALTMEQCEHIKIAVCDLTGGNRTLVLDRNTELSILSVSDIMARSEHPLPTDAKDYCATCDGVHSQERHDRLARLHAGADRR